MSTTDFTYVYVMAFVEDGKFFGPVKIGIAGNPDSRAAEMQTAHHETLAVIARFLTPSREYARDIEAGAHRLLAGAKIRGEWFSLEPAAAVGAVCKCVEVALIADHGVTDELLPKLLRWIGWEEARATVARLSLPKDGLQ